MKKAYMGMKALAAITIVLSGCTEQKEQSEAAEVQKKLLVKEDEGVKLDITIPQVEGLNEFNQQAIKLGEDLEAAARESQEIYLDENPNASQTVFSEGDMKFDVKFVDDQSVSVLNEIFFYAAGGANGVTLYEPLNYDLGTGSAIELADLFISDNYLVELSELASLKTETMDVKQWVDDPSMEIDEDQQYYLTSENVVLVYDQHEIAAGVAGAIEIPIAKSDLESLKEIYR